ncbi:MAG: hypothetical protein IJV31_12730 [Clostridia bacterium]|nr:hypothetical protein [Clostridia bacterium]
MNNEKNIVKIIDTSLEYIIAFIIILNTNSVFANLTKIDLHLNVVLIFILSIYFLRKIIKRDIKTTYLNIKGEISKYYKIFSIYILYLVFFLIFNRNEFKRFISVFMIIFPLLTYIFINNGGVKIFRKIINIMFVLATISLIFYLLVSIFRIIKPTNYVEIEWGGIHNINSFCNIYFETQRFDGLGLHIQRNTGIFVEAPMYSLCLCIAVALEEFIVKRRKIIINIILILTIITTFSTTGIITISYIYILKIVNKFITKKYINKRKKFIMIFITIILIIIAGIYFIQRIQTSSGSIRLDDYKASFKAWKDAPLFGNGYQDTDSIKKYMSPFRYYNMGLSNSIMVLLAQCGIYFSILYIYPFIETIKNLTKKKEYDIIFFETTIILLFITTIFMYKPIMISILAFLYSYIINTNILKEREKYEKVNN